MTGFSASVAARLALALAFIGATGAMVAVIETPRRHPTAEPTASGMNAASDARLAIDSTYRVGSWTVQVAGVDQAPARSDELSWSGTVRLNRHDEVFIRATAKPEPQGADPIPYRSLRICLGSTAERVIWSTGDVTTTARMPP